MWLLLACAPSPQAVRSLEVLGAMEDLRSAGFFHVFLYNRRDSVGAWVRLEGTPVEGLQRDLSGTEEYMHLRTGHWVFDPFRDYCGEGGEERIEERFHSLSGSALVHDVRFDPWTFSLTVTDLTLVSETDEIEVGDATWEDIPYLGDAGGCFAW